MRVVPGLEVLLERLVRVVHCPTVGAVRVVVGFQETLVVRRLQRMRLLPQLDQTRPKRDRAPEVVDARRVHEHVQHLEQPKLKAL